MIYLSSDVAAIKFTDTRARGKGVNMEAAKRAARNHRKGLH